MTPTTFLSYLRAWKAWKLSSGDSVGWPATTPLGRAIEYRTVVRGSRHETPDLRQTTDEELFDSCVSALRSQRPALYPVFLAYHLGQVGDEAVRHMPHADRASKLLLSPRTYRWRVRRSEDWLHRDLAARLGLTSRVAA